MNSKTFVITGPTAGIGLETALELSKHGQVVLVGRDSRKLVEVRKRIEARGGSARSVVADMSDVASVQRAAAEIRGLGLNIVGVVNNAGIREAKPTRSAQGWDRSFATNHVGPFVFTEALLPALPDGATVVFVVSAVEDPTRGPAKAAGFMGARYISAQASARGEWKPGGSTKIPGGDAYATSKQGGIVATMVLARETTRIRFVAVEPGFTPATGLDREASAFTRFMTKYVLGTLAPLLPHGSTPRRSARTITAAVLNENGLTGAYLDEKGRPMHASEQASSTEFQERYVRETRALLADVKG